MHARCKLISYWIAQFAMLIQSKQASRCQRMLSKSEHKWSLTSAGMNGIIASKFCKLKVSHPSHLDLVSTNALTCPLMCD